MEEKKLSERFDTEDQGEVDYCLDMLIKQNGKQVVLTINQRTYLTSVLKRFGMSDCKPVATPMESSKRFNKIADDEDPINITEHQSTIGCLICASRPDLLQDLICHLQFSGSVQSLKSAHVETRRATLDQG